MRRNMMLGELIQTLERKDPEAVMRFNFGRFRPDGFRSYRGYYEQLAIGYTEDDANAVKCGDFLKQLEGCNGQTFHGWKGGEYTMHARTPLWAANSGEAPGIAITDVRDVGSYLLLVTELVDD